MEIQFQKNVINYMKTLLLEQQKQELTQQIRLSDTMPDIGRVLGCWGQIVIRGKEWRSGSVGVSGGVIVWVLYQPEDEGTPCCVDSWIPFQMKWDAEETERDGVMDVCTSVCHIDARMLSDRKLIVRANISVQMHAMVGADAVLYLPDETPEDIQLLQRTYPMLLPKEAGEKQFDIEQQLDIPPDGARVHKLIRFTALPMLSEYKTVADKLVFRGNAEIYALYLDEFGRIHSNNWKVPFSQYTQLDMEYPSEADVSVCFELTQLELEIAQPDALNLKLGFTAQYIVYAIQNITATEDMYSTTREVKLHCDQIYLPSVLQKKEQEIKVEAAHSEGRILDVSMQLEPPRIIREEDHADTELEGGFQILYEDAEGKIQTTSERWKKTISGFTAANSEIHITAREASVPELESGIGVDINLSEQIINTEPLQLVVGSQTGENIAPDPLRPSIILRRVGEDSLWNIAKSTGSAVELIRNANGIQDEPNADQMLLIPIN